VKYLKIILLIILLWADSEASGIFSLGLMAGAANDPGNVEKTAADINMEMRGVAGADVKEIETAYTPVFSVNLGYINDALLVKTGWEYTTNIFYNSKGSITNAGAEDKIELDYSRYTFPVSIGVVIPLTNRNRLYFAGGVNMSYVLMKVKQTNPAVVPLSLYPGESHTFSAFLAGKHLKFGADALISRNYSFEMEFTKYFGNNKRVQSEDKNSQTLMSVNSFEITAGINYCVDFKI